MICKNTKSKFFHFTIVLIIIVFGTIVYLRSGNDSSLTQHYIKDERVIYEHKYNLVYDNKTSVDFLFKEYINFFPFKPIIKYKKALFLNKIFKDLETEKIYKNTDNNLLYSKILLIDEYYTYSGINEFVRDSDTKLTIISLFIIIGFYCFLYFVSKYIRMENLRFIFRSVIILSIIYNIFFIIKTESLNKENTSIINKNIKKYNYSIKNAIKEVP